MGVILFCLLIFFISISSFSIKRALPPYTLSILTISFFFPFIGAYYSFITQVGDWPTYFDGAATFGFGTQFVTWVTQNIFKPLAGGDLLSTYFIFAMFGFIGRVFSVFLLFSLLKKYSVYNGAVFCLKRSKWIIALLLCWPTVVFWGSLLGKDSLQYCFIFIFLYSIFCLRDKERICGTIVSVMLLGLIRPYSVAIIAIAFMFYSLFLAKMWLRYKIMSALVAMALVLLGASILQQKYGVDIFSVSDLSQYGLHNQIYQSRGTAIPVYASSGVAYFLNLPWTMLANMFLPLPGIYSTNANAWMTSFLNLFLLLLIFRLYKLLRGNKNDKKRYLLNCVYFMISYCFAGFLLLGATNTNLGLADRQKIPYVGMILIIWGILRYINWTKQYEKK